MRFHIDARPEELIAGGSSPKDARAQAEREFGDIEDAREYIARMDRATEGAQRRRLFAEEFSQDIVYAMRRLRSSKGFAITAIVTLALGIGANTAISSMVRGVLLRPLPFPELDELYRVWSANSSTGTLHVLASPPDSGGLESPETESCRRGWLLVRRWREWSGPDRLRGARTFVDRVRDLGILWNARDGTAGRPTAPGRGDGAWRADHGVVLTHGFWQRRFGGSPEEIGSALTLDGKPYEVLGVMPPELRYPTDRADVFVPYSSIPDGSIPHINPVRILAGMRERARA